MPIPTFNPPARGAVDTPNANKMVVVTKEAFIDFLAGMCLGGIPDTIAISKSQNWDHQAIVGHVKSLAAIAAIKTEQTPCKLLNAYRIKK